MTGRLSISKSVFRINIGGPAEAIGLDKREEIIDPGENVRVRIRGRGTAKSSIQADAWGIKGDTLIFRGERDRLTGEASAKGLYPGIKVNAIGIEAVHICMGDGNDRLTGKATAEGLNPTDNDVTAIGIKNAHIKLEGGDDTINAIANGNGSNFGIENVTIDGGRGNDLFNIQSGIGEIIGGRDIDTLRLEGSVEDYNFAEIPGLELGVHITTNLDVLDPLNSTDLFVREVERFRFSDQLSFVDYHDLLV